MHTHAHAPTHTHTRTHTHTVQPANHPQNWRSTPNIDQFWGRFFTGDPLPPGSWSGNTWTWINKWNDYNLNPLRWGWVFLERTRILSGIQFTTHFIDFFVVETKRFVSSTVNVILTRQTCGQRSSRAAESKRPAICSLYQNVEETEI